MTRLVLNLSQHCIQTEIKSIYKRLLSDCLKSSAIDVETETKIELLVHALETFDFAGLRAEYPELAGGTEAEVALIREDNGRILIKTEDRVILP
ncbi:MAG: hypothetical protein R6U29_02250 [Desulfosudaceae bacterium]